MAYVDQSRDHLADTKTVWEEVSEGQDIMRIGKHEIASRAYVGRFNFKGTDQQKFVGTLSGGERNRLLLARLFLKPANLLIMDEPTNDLDLETLDILRDTLLNYQGTLIVISHDRDFLDSVVTGIWSFDTDHTLREYVGG